MEGYVWHLLSLNKSVCDHYFLAGPYFVSFPNLREALANNMTIQTQARSCTILPNFVGYALNKYAIVVIADFSSDSVRFGVHNGKTYVPVTITQDMVGHKLGEFAPTRKQFTYKYVAVHTFSSPVISSFHSI